jgi:hypothetical protein
MNPIFDDRLIELHMKEIRDEMCQINLGLQADMSKPRQSGWISNLVELLGRWLIREGESLLESQRATRMKHHQSTCNVAQ